MQYLSIVLILFLSFNLNAQRIVKNKVTDYDASSSMVSYLSSTGEVSEVEVDLKYVSGGIQVIQLFDTGTGDKYYSIEENGRKIIKYEKDLFDRELDVISLNLPDADIIKILLNKCNDLIIKSLKNPTSFKPLNYDIRKSLHDDGKDLYNIKVEYIGTNSYGAEIGKEKYFEFNHKLKRSFLSSIIH